MRAAILVLALLVVMMLFGSLFAVWEGQSAIVVRLGEVRRDPITEPGLYFKMPLLDDVIRFNARILSWDGDPERIPVKGSNFMFVDTFARWRISDPLAFYKKVQSEQRAQSRLDDILDGSVRDVVSNHYDVELVRTTKRPLPSSRPQFGAASDPQKVRKILSDIVEEGDEEEDVGMDLLTRSPDLGGKRLEVQQTIFDISSRKLQEQEMGIELIDIRIKRLDYTDQVVEEVYRRMRSEQEEISERFRAQGQGKKAEIEGETVQEQRRIESESYRRAQEILGEAEAESTRIYAEAYGRDPEFYRFLKSLETYQIVLGSDDTLILSTDSDLLRYLKTQR